MTLWSPDPAPLANHTEGLLHRSIAPRSSLLTFVSLTVGGLFTVVAGSAYATSRYIETRVVMSKEDKEAFARKVSSCSIPGIA